MPGTNFSAQGGLSVGHQPPTAGSAHGLLEPQTSLELSREQPVDEVLLLYSYRGQAILVSIRRADLDDLVKQRQWLPSAPSDQNTLVDINHETLLPIIEGRRASGETTTRTDPRTAQTLPLVELTRPELEQGIVLHQITYDAALAAESLAAGGDSSQPTEPPPVSSYQTIDQGMIHRPTINPAAVVQNIEVVTPPSTPDVVSEAVATARGTGAMVGAGASIAEGIGTTRRAPRQSTDTTPAPSADELSNIRHNIENILLFAISLEKLARERIEKLEAENHTKNDPDAIDRNRQEIELLAILADGFVRVISALQDFAQSPDQPILLGKAAAAVKFVGDQMRTWWQEHPVEARDWAVRLPVIGIALSMLSLTGADMTFATAGIMTIVGGEKVARSIRTRHKS